MYMQSNAAKGLGTRSEVSLELLRFQDFNDVLLWSKFANTPIHILYQCQMNEEHASEQERTGDHLQW